MHWAYQIAEKLIKKHPTKEVFTCASGISPSGSVHVGNFREVVTTFFVVKALESLGKKTRFIFSWDDFDRLRKVPQNVSPSYESYVGLPYSDVPNPFGKGSYASHFEKEFEHSLQAFRIKPEYIYQSREYRSGRYSSFILTALKKRKEIYDILMRFKSSEPLEGERETFYPIALYCDACGKDATTIQAFQEKLKSVEYECNCGNTGSQTVSDRSNIKLNWKVDWAMRWMVEDVVFEPGGRDHSSATGSYNVSKIIAEEIFDYEAPDYVAYEFIGLKGTNQKMSSSSGNVITPNDLLFVYTPELILFMFAKYKPSAAFNIGLDEDVLRNYSESERYQSAYARGVLKDEEILRSLELAGADSITKHPHFNQVAGIFPLINFNTDVLQTSLKETGEDYTLEDIKLISDRVAYWIEHWNPHRSISINQEKNDSYYNSLTEEQKDKVNQLSELLSCEPILKGDSFMSRIYGICRQDDKKRMRECQKDLFKNVYQLVTNENNGPRLPLLITAVGREKMIELLTFP
jgi:lysyl-tRNA synthetase class 1